MNHVVCSVYDRAAQVYGRPFYAPAKGSAIRSFTDEVNRVAPDNDLNKHPDDFDLFSLGSFDDNSGVMHPECVLIVRGKECVSKE